MSDGVVGTNRELRSRRALIGAIAVVVALAACGGGPVAEDTTLESSSAPDTMAGTTQDLGTPDGDVSTAPGNEHDPTAYLTEMTTLVVEYRDEVAAFPADYAAANPPSATDQDSVAFMTGFLLGLAEIGLEHADAIDRVVAPRSFQDAHRAYADAVRRLYERWREVVAGLTTPDQLEAFWAALVDPSTGIPAPLADLDVAFIEACQNLELAAANSGHLLDMLCPQPPAQALVLEVEVGDSWTAAPDPLPLGDGLVELRIVNTGHDPVRPVVLDIFEGDPVDLPVVGGLVDISRSGVFDPPSGHAPFGVAYPDGLLGDDSHLLAEPPELLPGEFVDARLWISGDIVVFDYRAGEFEAGSYVVIART